ncbi:MAG: HAD-IA family hydrolase [Pseudomonadota bacterium]
MTECIIFDLDGTLVDSEPLCNKAFRDLLPSLELSVSELIKRFRGKKLAHIFAELDTLIDEQVPADFEGVYRAQIEENFATSLKAFPSVSDALRSLDLPICVASSGPLTKIRSALAKTHLADFFQDRVFSSYEVGRWKPDPGLFLHAAEKMGVPPNMCIVVEDSLAGISAAQSAGMIPLHFSRDTEPINGITSFDDYENLNTLIRELSSS